MTALYDLIVRLALVCTQLHFLKGLFKQNALFSFSSSYNTRCKISTTFKIILENYLSRGAHAAVVENDIILNVL
jgi:hypothetical protein